MLTFSFQSVNFLILHKSVFPPPILKSLPETIPVKKWFKMRPTWDSRGERRFLLLNVSKLVGLCQAFQPYFVFAGWRHIWSRLKDSCKLTFSTYLLKIIYRCQVFEHFELYFWQHQHRHHRYTKQSRHSFCWTIFLTKSNL